MQKAKSLKQTGPGIQDEEQWARNVQGYMRGLPNPGTMSAAAPILIPLKQWCEKKLVSITDFKAVMDDMQKRIRNMQYRYCRLVRPQRLDLT